MVILCQAPYRRGRRRWWKPVSTPACYPGQQEAGFAYQEASGLEPQLGFLSVALREAPVGRFEFAGEPGEVDGRLSFTVGNLDAAAEIQVVDGGEALRRQEESRRRLEKNPGIEDDGARVYMESLDPKAAIPGEGLGPAELFDGDSEL